MPHFGTKKAFFQNIQYSHLCNVIPYHCAKLQKKILSEDSEKTYNIISPIWGTNAP